MICRSRASLFAIVSAAVLLLFPLVAGAQSLDELRAEGVSAYERLPDVVTGNDAALFAESVRFLFAYEQRMYRRQGRPGARLMEAMTWLYQNIDAFKRGKGDSPYPPRYRRTEALRSKGMAKYRKARGSIPDGDDRVWDVQAFISASANLYAYLQVASSPENQAKEAFGWLQAKLERNEVVTSGTKGDRHGPDPNAWIPAGEKPMYLRDATLPDFASRWIGTYSGRIDGRRARIAIQADAANTALKLHLEGLDRGVNFSGTISADKVSQAPEHILEDVTLTGSDGEKTFERLFLHNDSDNISGYTNWSGTNYGVGFSENGLSSPASERGKMNRERWASEWHGRYKGQLDGRKATLEITLPSNQGIRVELQDAARGMVFTKEIDKSTQAENSPPHVLKDITLTTQGDEVKHIERLMLHTWDTNYISGYTEWRGTDYGNYFVRVDR